MAKLKLETINFWLISALLFLLPFEIYPFVQFKGLQIRPNHVLTLAIIIINLPKLWQNRTKLLQNPWVFFVGFLAVAGISLLYNGPNRLGLYALVLYVFELLLAFTVALSVKKTNLTWFRNIIFIAGACMAGFALWQILGDSFGFARELTLLDTRYTHTIFGYPRTHGLSFEPIFFANYLFIPFTLAIVSWLIEKKTLFFWVAAIFATVICLTVSRSAWFGLAAVFFVLIASTLIQKRYRMALKVLGCFGLALGAAAVILVASMAIIRHKATSIAQVANPPIVAQTQFVNPENNTSTLSRAVAWRIAARQFLQHPILGIGPSRVQQAIQAQITSDQFLQAGNTKANNVYLEVLSEDGLFGGALLLGFIIGFVWLGIRASKKNLSVIQRTWAYAIGLVAIPFIIQWNVVSNLAVTHTWILAGVFISIVGTSKISWVEKAYQKIQKSIWLKQNKLALLICILAAIYYLLFEFLLYRKFQFPMLDLGMFNRHMFGLLHYGIDVNPLKGYNLLGDHAHFFLLLLLPLYYFWQNPEFLLAVQVLFIVLSGWPIYLIAKKYSPNAKLAALWLLPYFMFFGFWSALAYPFHDSAAAVLPLAWVLYFLLVSKKYWYLGITLIILVLFREDMPLVAVMVGIYLVVIERKYLLGAVIGLLSATYFMWVTKIWLPLFGPATYGYERTQFGVSVLDVAKAAVFHPFEVVKSFIYPYQKLQSMLAMILSFGGLSIFALEILILLLPLWLGRFLSIETWRWGPIEHYSASQAPILAAASIVGLHKVLQYLHQRFGYNKVRTFTTAIIITSVLAFGLNLVQNQKAIIKPLAVQFYRLTPTERSAHDALAIIPGDASLGAQSAFPQVSSRRAIYNLPLPYGARPDYILLSSKLDMWPFENATELMDYETQLEAQGYQQIFSQNDVYILKKANDFDR